MISQIQKTEDTPSNHISSHPTPTPAPAPNSEMSDEKGLSLQVLEIPSTGQRKIIRSSINIYTFGTSKNWPASPKNLNR